MANELGKAMGREITKGITDGLDVTKIMRDVTAKAVPASRIMGNKMGSEIQKGIAETFSIAPIIVEATKKAKVAARIAGRDLGDTYGRAFRHGLDDALKGIKAKVDVDINKASLARAKAEVRHSVGSVKADVSVGTSEVQKAERALGRGGGGGIIAGIGALIRSLPGGTSGSIAAVPTSVGIPAGIIAASALPFIGQMLAGVPIAAGGGALAGLGIAGAFGIGGTSPQQVQQARLANQAANARVTAALARVAQARGGGAAASPLQIQAAQDRLAAAQARLATARSSGTSAAAILSAEAGVASAQDRINRLRGTGKVNTAQLAAAEAQLAGARAAQSKASTAYHKAQQNEITKNQMAARQAFIDLKNTAVQSLTQIGAPMAPVMKHIADTARGVLQKLTPVFKIVVADIAGPFQTFVDTILKAFQDPATQAAIEAVAGAFVDVLKAFTPDIKGIMDSFSDAIRRIADSVAKNPKAFADFLNFVFQLGIMLLNAVAYLSDFASYIEQHFIPAVHHVINFFKGIGINLGKFWHAVIDNFKQSIGIIIDILKFFRDIWTGHWSAAGHDIVDIGKRFWRIIVNDFKVIIPDLLRLMGYLGSHLVSIAKGAFDHLWWLILNIGDRGRHSVANQWDQFRHDMATIATHIWHDITGFFSLMWHQILGDFDTFNRAYLGALNKFKNMVLGFFRDAINWLSSAGSSVIHGMLNGIDNAMKDIGNWVKKHIVNPIVNWVKHHFGIASPSTVMMGLGVNLIEGLLRGLMKNSGNVGKIVLKIFGSIPNALGAIVGKGLIALEKLPASAIKLLGSVGGKIGGFFSHLFHGGPAGQGVMRWADLVKVALMLNNLPDSLAGRVLYQMQTESGGNPNAINLWDINAQRGDPSRGLMQVIGSTFAAYHVPGTSMNIYDPLANIAAAINYAKHVYGPGLGALGSGHGYAAGTGGATPGWAWVGERGPELVNFSGGETVIPAIRLGGYASGTLSAAEAIAAHNKALAEATAAAHRSQAMAIAAANKMANAGATLAARIAAITAKTTPATWTTDLRLFFKDLRLYFSPKTAEARSKLVQSQINQMKSLQTSITKMDANITNAIAFQKQQYSQLRAQTGIGTIGIQGVGAAGGRSILAGLQRNLSSARSFGLAIRDLSRAGASQAVLKTVAAMDPASGSVYARKMISALNKMHSMKLSPEMINQLVALGPDAALAYINAIQAGGPSLLKQVKSTEAALEAARVSTSRGITSVVSGGAYVTGVNFVAGLKSQQKALEKQFAHLGKVLGEEAIKWMGVPYSKRPRGYASGGWLNEPVTGYGLYSGATYTFAEHGREYVIPEGGPTRGGDGGTQYIAHFDGLTREAIESHVRTAFNAMALTQGALQRNGRRSL